MGAKFFVFGGRRWRELDTDDGNLEGWGCARFVYYRRGRLHIARSGAVLRALRALGAGCGKAARDGLPLSIYEPQPSLKKRQQNFHACCSCQPQHCIRCSNDVMFDRLLRPGTSEAAVQCVATANAEVQVTLATESQSATKDDSQNRRPVTEPKSSARHESQNRLRPVTESKSSPRKESRNELRPVTESKSSPRKESHNGRRPVTGSKSVEDKVTSENRVTQRDKKRKRQSSSDSAEDSSNDGRGGQDVKELIIEESDVEVLRRFLLRDESGLLDVDVDRFVAEDKYKERVFYAINPLVMVERCPRIARLLSDKRKQTQKRERDSDMALRQFMRVLGLKTVGEESSAKRYKTRASINNDKENAVKGYETMTRVRSSIRPAKVLREDNDSQREPHSKRKPTPQKAVSKQVLEISSDDEFLASKASVRQTRFVKQDNVVSSSGGKGGSSNSKGSGSGSGTVGKGRAYSAEEDAAIVSWVSRGSRARSVNGNCLWRQLQRHHEETTGTVRSWHSLRNRYLRYLLPSLPTLTSEQDAQRLRAAAAKGELKSRKQPPKENSLLVLPRVRSAWTLRRPTPTRSPTRSPTPTQRPTRRNASTPTQTEAAVPRRTPRLSELARRFASRPGDSRDSAPSRRSTRSSGPSPQPPKEPHRRRLFNHRAVL